MTPMLTVYPRIVLLALALLPLKEAAARTYTTNFPLTENPISEGGNWVNGGSVGVDWSNVSTTGGFARGQQIPDRGGSLNYNDSTALVTGAWGPDQTVQVTVQNTNTNPSAIMEVEIRLRSSMSVHNSGGYEIYWSAQSTNPYLIIGRWNGPVGSWQNLASTSQGVSVKTGDVLKASIVGTVITAWINGVQKLQYDTKNDGVKFSSGNPGIGFYLQNSGGSPALQANYGFTSFSATDGLSALPAPTNLRVMP